jgi:hypothetical protein
VKRTLILSTLLGASVSVAHAGPLAVEVLPATSTWQQGKPVEVTLKITNTSKAEETFQVMSCSWEDHWASSDRELIWSPWSCDKNFPARVALAPGKAREWKLSMYAAAKATPGAHSLVMTFTPRDGTPTKSGAVAITVTR